MSKIDAEVAYLINNLPDPGPVLDQRRMAYQMDAAIRLHALLIQQLSLLTQVLQDATVKIGDSQTQMSEMTEIMSKRLEDIRVVISSNGV
jgi:hypothetical protein